jgi:hypothetical protein
MGPCGGVDPLLKEKGSSRNPLQAQPSEEMSDDIPLGYSGLTALRREQCDSTPETIGNQL